MSPHCAMSAGPLSPASTLQVWSIKSDGATHSDPKCRSKNPKIQNDYKDYTPKVHDFPWNIDLQNPKSSKIIQNHPKSSKNPPKSSKIIQNLGLSNAIHAIQGEVEVAGADSGFSVGDRVFGCSFFGAYASRASENRGGCWGFYGGFLSHGIPKWVWVKTY